MALIHHIGAVAKRKMNIEGWEPYSWESVGPDGTLVKGGIPRILKRGQRKGQKTWDGKGDKVMVVGVEVSAEIARYEKETGNCPSCLGKKETLKSWNHIPGETLMECVLCKGTGKTFKR